MSVEVLYETMGLLRVVELDPAGRAVLEYEAGAHLCHSGGVVQGGFVIGAGILLDTFLVRTVLVPSIATLMGRANWWPSRLTWQGRARA